MSLPKPGCWWWPASAVALCAVLLLALAGVATGHAGHDHGASPSPIPADAIPIAHILVSPYDDAVAAPAVRDEAAWAAAEAEAADLLALIEAQPVDGFARLALERSDDLASAFEGGHLGVVRTSGASSSIPDPVVEAVRALVDPAPGTTLGPIRSPLGWHIVRIEDPAAVPVAWPDSRAMEPAVILLDPGLEPRQILRFAPDEGVTAAVPFSIRLATTRSAGNGALDLGHGSLDGAWIASATPEPDAGGTRLDLVLEEIGAAGFEGADEADLAEATALLVGLTASIVVGPNGVPISTVVDLPDGLDPVLAQAVLRSVDSVADAVGTYPEEPVGPGARWSTVREIPGLDGELGELISTRTLLAAVDGTTLQLTTATSRFASAGMAEVPGAGASVRLAESEQSVATGTVDPATLALAASQRANGIAWYSPLAGGDMVTRTVVATLELGGANGG